MTSKCFITLTVVSLALACSSSGAPSGGAPSGGPAGANGGTSAGGRRCHAPGAGQSGGGTAGLLEQSEADALIVPAGLDVRALEGGNGVLDVLALTLRAGTSATEIYAALRNDGDVPACSAGFSVQLFDSAGQSIAASITGLLSTSLYRLTDGSDSVVSCIGPGDVAMAAITDLPSDLVLETVRSVVYQTPYFALDVAPLDAHLNVSGLRAVAASDGTTYTGTVVNGFDFAVSRPTVTVFPVNCAGRPLGVATGSGSMDIPPRGTWSFETTSVDTPGVDAKAYASGALSSDASP
jgi:hypothetical protein